MRRYHFVLLKPPNYYNREEEIEALDAADALVMMKVRLSSMNRSEGKESKWYICEMKYMPSITAKGTTT